MGGEGIGLWDEEDQFYYVLLNLPGGERVPLRVRSLVGLIPLFAVERLEESWIEPFQEFRSHLHWFLKNRKELVQGVVHTIEHDDDITHALTILHQDQIRRIARRSMDPNEFPSPSGVRRPAPDVPPFPLFLLASPVPSHPVTVAFRHLQGSGVFPTP